MKAGKALSFPMNGALLLFAAKLTVASLLSLAIAFWANLPEPYWAVVTVAVLANPNADQVTIKSLARICGTLVGAAFAVCLVVLFDQQRELFIGALCLWLGLCAWLSMWFRDSEAYAIELAGYTAALIALDIGSNPQTTFDMASGRVSEVFVGIGVTWLVALLLFPKTSSAELPGKIHKAAAKLVDCLQAGQAGAGARVQMASLITVLHGFGRRIPIGQAGGRRRLVTVRSIYVALMRALFLSCALSGADRRRAEMDVLVAALPAALLNEDEARKAQLQWETAIAHLEEKSRQVASHGRQSDTTVLWLRFATQCRQFLIGYQALLNPAVEPVPVQGRFHLADADGLLSSISAVQIMVSVVILSWFWFATGWISGIGSVVIASVYALRLAPKLHATGAYRMMLWVTLICTVPALVLTFQIIPHAETFVALALVLTPYLFAAFMVGGLGGPYAPMSILIVLVLTVVWQPENQMVSYEFASAMDGVLSIFAGFFFCAIVNLLIIPTSPWLLRWRLMRAASRTLRRASSQTVDALNQDETRLSFLASEIAPEFHAQKDPFQVTEAAFNTGLAALALARLYDLVEAPDTWHEDVQSLRRSTLQLSLLRWEQGVCDLVRLAEQGKQKVYAAIAPDEEGRLCQAATSFEVLHQSLLSLESISIRPAGWVILAEVGG